MEITIESPTRSAESKPIYTHDQVLSAFQKGYVFYEKTIWGFKEKLALSIDNLDKNPPLTDSEKKVWPIFMSVCLADKKLKVMKNRLRLIQLPERVMKEFRLKE